MAKNQETKVTRITANSTNEKSNVKKSKLVNANNKKSSAPKRKRSFGFLGRFAGYFKGAWYELRQVHWPTRSATWGLTGAVLLFSAFFVVFITLLDAGFKYVFEQILR